jgi:RNAse (barnase) inhibitor barstar
MKPIYEIDGSRFSTLEDFFDEFHRVLALDYSYGRIPNLDAFDDILQGGFGTPEGGFTIKWKNSRLSRERLGYPETARQLEIRLQRCHPSNRTYVAADLAAAKNSTGSTVFDWLVEIIRDHGSGGQQAEDGVELVLD